ncbi:pentapeptide repeat-containing protein [Caballeronia sp. SBC2]|uniref:pentapeptide repeat-containing protein n=1 Tax=Caballeronia sp. SBC2 TaxID=2705547 RepID=UPI0019D2FFF9|nr:pentapeptide repeat-containing protein [Caballeronia sp. SBC2]
MNAPPIKEGSRPLSFHWLVDVATLLSSIATVIALVFLIHDRRDQANIAAWTLLQTYLQQEHRPDFNEGQGFALETLTRNGVDLSGLDVHASFIFTANLHGLIANYSSFKNARLRDLDLSDASFNWADLEFANIWSCECQRARFTDANLRNATLANGTYQDADFHNADVSGLWFSTSHQDPDLFKNTCYRPGDPPHLDSARLPMPFAPPADPQGKLCIQRWGKQWAAIKTP